jgi:hypothetical protein
LRTGTQDLGIIEKGLLKFDSLLTADRWSDVAALAEPFCQTQETKGCSQWLSEDNKILLLLTPDGWW